MNFEILKQAETQFREIADFYVNWNAEPENIISYLMEHPSTKRRMDNNVKVREQFALQKIKKEGGVSGPGMDYKLANGQWLGVKLKQVIPEPYKLSGLDVDAYIFHTRIVPLLNEGLTAFVGELKVTASAAEERSRVDWCQEFRRVLETLSEQLTTFDSRPLSIPNEIENWPDIDHTLRTLANDHIRPLLDQYEGIIKKYLPNTSSIENQPDGLTRRERVLILCYEDKEVIKRGEPDYNDYITFATPTKRLAYPNGSAVKAKRLIVSINKILPHLSKNATQQAINEVNTIESNI